MTKAAASGVDAAAFLYIGILLFIYLSLHRVLDGTKSLRSLSVSSVSVTTM